MKGPSSTSARAVTRNRKPHLRQTPFRRVFCLQRETAAAGVGKGPRARSRRCSLVIWTSGEAAICWPWLYKSFQELLDRKKGRKDNERAPGIVLGTSGSSKTSSHLPRSFAFLVSVLPPLSLSVESGLMLRPPLSKCPQRVLPCCHLLVPKKTKTKAHPARSQPRK